MMAEVVIYAEAEEQLPAARTLAKQLQLPLVGGLTEQFSYALVYTQSYLELRLPDKRMKPIVVDFFSPEMLYRVKELRGRNELIARAVGIKRDHIPKVVDATAGLGQDAFILASLGCDVIMLERSPIVWALLSDGLKRASQADAKQVANLQLYFTNAVEYLEEKKELIDVIYLDPMFPVRSKSALVKKEMRVLKSLVGEDLDANELFAVAKDHARRVVVKRPRHADTLTAEIPDVVFTAKACRFDVYLPVK